MGKAAKRSTQEVQRHEVVQKPVVTKGDLTRFVEHSDIGIVVKKIRMRLVEFAMTKDDPMRFLEAQAAAVQEALDAGKDPPELPVKDATGSPRPMPACPTSQRHRDIHCWCLAAGRRRRYICNDCGTEWTTK